jgi:RimJ/RimL family protein N-acetyltransferase
MTTDDPFIDLKCPYCGFNNSFPRQEPGFLRECLNCSETMIVPRDGSDTAARPTLPIVAPRLTLRRMVPDDAPGLMEFMKESEPEIIDWLKRQPQIKLTSRHNWFEIGIQPKDSDKLIGYVSMFNSEVQLRQMDINIEFNPRFDASGLAAEAVNAMLGFCFNELRMHRAIAICDSEETRSRGFYSGAGMRQEGEAIQCTLVDGRWRNLIYYAMLDEEYRAK